MSLVGERVVKLETTTAGQTGGIEFVSLASPRWLSATATFVPHFNRPARTLAVTNRCTSYSATGP